MPILNCKIGNRTVIPQPELVNLYHCTIGEECMIAAFVEIGKGVVIGNRVRIQAHSFIPTGVVIEDESFVGPRVTFTNDKEPPSRRGDWSTIETRVERGAAIGAGAVILPGVTIGAGALIGAGAVVTRDVPANTVWVGCPAAEMRQRVINLVKTE